MLQNGKTVKSIWLGGEKFDKIATKLKSYIGTQVYVKTTDNLKDLEISIKSGPLINSIQSITPQKDGDVSVTNIIWDGDSSVDLIGSVAVYYNVADNTSESSISHTDLCIIDNESI